MTEKQGPFPWGQVLRIHEIGEYRFTEYHPWAGVRQIADPYLTEFHYEAGHCSATSLDAILIKAICIKYAGSNERLSEYVYKALEMKE